MTALAAMSKTFARIKILVERDVYEVHWEVNQGLRSPRGLNLPNNAFSVNFYDANERQPDGTEAQLSACCRMHLLRTSRPPMKGESMDANGCMKRKIYTLDGKEVGDHDYNPITHEIVEYID